MDERILLVKLFDLNKVEIGKGRLLSIRNNTILVKGKNLPILSSGLNIVLNIYDELAGISPYLCIVSVASKSQLTAQIIRKDTIIERRTALKVRTDLSFYLSKIHRNDEDITEELPSIKINILNLSIGGMLISSNVEFLLNDIIMFYFKYFKGKPIFLEAKVIRIDKIEDEDDENKITYNYGCCFISLSSNDEAVLCQYLFDRQLQLYRNK